MRPECVVCAVLGCKFKIRFLELASVSSDALTATTNHTALAACFASKLAVSSETTSSTLCTTNGANASVKVFTVTSTVSSSGLLATDLSAWHICYYSVYLTTGM